MSKKILIGAAALIVALIGLFVARKPAPAFYMTSANGQRLLIVEPAGRSRALVHAFFPPDGERVRATRASVEVRCASGEQRRVSLALLADDGSVLDVNRRRTVWSKAKAGTPDDATFLAVCKPAEVAAMKLPQARSAGELAPVRDVYLKEAAAQRVKDEKERAARLEAAKTEGPDMPAAIPYFPD